MSPKPFKAPEMPSRMIMQLAEHWTSIMLLSFLLCNDKSSLDMTFHLRVANDRQI